MFRQVKNQIDQFLPQPSGGIGIDVAHRRCKLSGRREFSEWRHSASLFLALVFMQQGRAFFFAAGERPAPEMPKASGW
jgi:hypothetical protein